MFLSSLCTKAYVSFWAKCRITHPKTNFWPRHWFTSCNDSVIPVLLCVREVPDCWQDSPLLIRSWVKEPWRPSSAVSSFASLFLWWFWNRSNHLFTIFLPILKLSCHSPCIQMFTEKHWISKVLTLHAKVNVITSKTQCTVLHNWHVTTSLKCTWNPIHTFCFRFIFSFPSTKKWNEKNLFSKNTQEMIYGNFLSF